MGMAASQARFLGLTARKTNVEYEGQQINQQRTSLSNQSANYYNDLLGMTVPVPPSVDNFTKTVYTFDDGALSNTITGMIAQADGTYTVSYLRKWTDDFSIVSAAPSVITRSGNEDAPKYSIGAKELRSLGTEIDESKFKDGNYTGDDEYLKSLGTKTEIEKLIEEEKQYLELLKKNFGGDSWFVRYVKDTSTGEYIPYFYNQNEVQTSSYDANNHSLSDIHCYTIGSATRQEEVKALTDCKIEKDSTGRYINITFPELENGVSKKDENGNIIYGPTYSLTTNTITDQAAYDDAMNQYEYEKYEYDQAINDINSKIEIIQAQDKNLELRLKQLDTEQDAISQEMEAIQKVIDKNTESTFKTFG